MEQVLKFYKRKRILISGGGGYLGSKLAEHLLTTESQIYLMDIKFNNISEDLIRNNSNVKRLKADITDIDELNLGCKEAYPDIVFHFAALLDRNREFNGYNLLYDVNVKGTLNLLESLKHTKYDTFIYGSTSEVYGVENISPFKEDLLPKPASPYSLTKLMAEYLLQNFSNLYCKPYSILRIFNFYGPQMPDNFFLSQIELALDRNEEFKMTSGEQIRDFLHIDEVCGLIMSVSSNSGINGEIINVCSGAGIKIKTLAENIALIKNKSHLLKIGALEYRKNEIWNMIGDSTKLKRICNK